MHFEPGGLKQVLETLRRYAGRDFEPGGLK